jgi:hypothetical protein
MAVMFVLGLVTFHMMILTHIFAILPGLDKTEDYYRTLLDFTYKAEPDRVRLTIYAMAVMLFIDVPEYLHQRHTWLVDKSHILRGFIYAIMITLLVLTWSKDYQPFIYFQF